MGGEEACMPPVPGGEPVKSRPHVGCTLWTVCTSSTSIAGSSGQPSLAFRTQHDLDEEGSGFRLRTQKEEAIPCA